MSAVPVDGAVDNGGGIDRRQFLRAAVSVGTILAVPGSGVGPPAPGRTSTPLLDQVVWGAYASTEPYPSCDSHFALERSLGTRLPWMSWFFNWSVPWPTLGGRQAADGGYDILLAWQPQKDKGRRVLFSDVLKGRHDDYLVRFFTRAAAHPGRVMIRFAHEMNGSGYPWAVGYRGARGSSVTDAEEFVATWRYVVQAQRGVGGDNVEFLWCIMSADKGGVPAEALYPGDDYVDALGMDLYNGYSGWQEPRAVITSSYRRLETINAGKPLWIAELGCREPSIREASGAAPEPGRSKAEWLSTLFASTDFPRLANINFFHAARAFDWRLDSTPEALAVCRDAFARRTRTPMVRGFRS